jgi:hypothetical protein
VQPPLGRALGLLARVPEALHRPIYRAKLRLEHHSALLIWHVLTPSTFTSMSYEDNNPFEEDEERLASFNQHSREHTIIADESMPTNFSPHAPTVPSFPTPARTSSIFTGRCQRMDQIPQYLEAGGSISIIDAGKNNEGSGGSFVSYTIRTGELEVRRRYNEFESLRTSLAKLYPCLIVPPIPEKQSITDYSAGAAKAREDIATIEHRKRMLEQFLRRTAIHQSLKLEKIFHRFLDPNVSWVSSHYICFQADFTE